MSSKEIWQNYVDGNGVKLADGVDVEELVEQYPVPDYDTLNRLFRNALLHVPQERNHFEVSDIDAAYDEIDIPVVEQATAAKAETNETPSSSRQIESDGGYTIVTAGDDPLDEKAGIAIDEETEIEGLKELERGDK